MTPDEALRRIQGGYATAMNRLATKLLRKEMTGREFLSRGRLLVREAHARADYLGQAKAGRRTSYAKTAPVAWRRVYREEIEFLRGFMEAILTGRYGRKEPSEKDLNAVKARAALYAKKLTGTANEAWAKTKVESWKTIYETDQEKDDAWAKLALYLSKVESGELLFLWVRHAEESCEDCIHEENLGWRPFHEFDRFPGDGSTKCRMNCKCNFLSEDGQYGFSNDPKKLRSVSIRQKDIPRDIISTKMQTLNLRDPFWRRARFSQEGLVYVLRDADTGEIMKVGQTTSYTFVGRFGEYVTAGNRFNINLELDVFETPLERRSEIEKAIRIELEKNNDLPWDNSGIRLHRSGRGIF